MTRVEAASENFGKKLHGKHLPERAQRFQSPQNYGLRGHRHERHVPNATREPHLISR